MYLKCQVLRVSNLPLSDLARQCWSEQQPGRFGVTAHRLSQAGAKAGVVDARLSQVAAHFRGHTHGLARGADCEHGPRYATVTPSMFASVSIVLLPSTDVGIELLPAWSDRRCSPLPRTQRPYISGQKMLM